MGERTFIIAEIGLNHAGNFNTALKLIDIAAEAEVDAVKFQKRDLPSLYPEDLLSHTERYEQSFQYIIPILKETQLPDDAYIRLKQYAEEKGLEFICTPFDIKSALFLNGIGTEKYKIASCDLTNFDLLRCVIEFNKPMILSTGMSTWSEIETTVSWLKKQCADFALLHCRSAYPVWPRECNLKMITKLKQFGVPVGYSGHDIGTTIPLIAASMGASIIEKHITLDRTMRGPDHKVSLEPDELKVLVRDIRIADQAMSTPDRFLLQGEVVNRDVFRYKGVYPKSEAPKIPNLKSQWGLIARHSDFGEVAKHKPQIIEYRLTENDFGRFKTDDWWMPNTNLIVHAPEYVGDKILDLCSGDQEIRERSVIMVRNTLIEALRMSSCFKPGTKIIVHPGAMSMNVELDKGTLKENLRKALIELCVPEHQTGIEILLENLPPYPWYFGGQWKGNYFMDPYEIADNCEGGFNLCFDLSHAFLYCNSTKTSLVEFIEIVRPYIRHMHLADAYGLDGEGMQIGKGDVDFKTIMPLLPDVTWVPEIWRGHINSNAGAIEALNKLGVYLNCVEEKNGHPKTKKFNYTKAPH